MRSLALFLLAAAGLAACGVPEAGEAPPAAAGAPTGAEAACVAAVKATTGAAEAAVMSAVPSGAGTEVLIYVPGASAPWSCRASAAGAVEQVVFTGEGAATG